MIRKGLLLSLPVLAVIFGLGLWGFFGSDPAAQHPVHWGLDGKPDRYGGRFEAFLGLPLVALAATLVLAIGPALDPRGDNLRRSEQAYLTGWIGTLAMLAVVQLGFTLIGLGLWSSGEDSPFPRVALGAGGLLILLLGNVLGKARPNWFVGVRTPWTLSSDIAWDRTHRLAGRLLVLAGAAGLVSAFLFSATVAAACLVAGVLISSLVATVYSWWVWRRAPDRRPGPQAVEP